MRSDTAQKMKNVRFPNKNVPILCHCEERSDVAILKLKAWHPAPKHGSTKQEGRPITKKGDSLRCLASSFFILRFCFVPRNHSLFRDGKSFRLRLPRRAQKMRPPRNDTKLAGFMKTLPVSYIGMYESVAERRRHGASSEAPCHAGAGPHFLCEAFFTQSRNHITLLFEIPGFRGSPKNNGRHECVRHYSFCYYRKQPTAAITLLPRAWACRGAYTWFS